ncbi:MAG: hypothetical protein RSG59_06895 [Ruthenibacterium sp.]
MFLENRGWSKEEKHSAAMEQNKKTVILGDALIFSAADVDQFDY